MDDLKFIKQSQRSSQPDHSADTQAMPHDAKSTPPRPVKKFLQIVNGY
jgi:hypothetical protein